MMHDPELSTFAAVGEYIAWLAQRCVAGCWCVPGRHILSLCSAGTFGWRERASGIVIWNDMRDYRSADKSLARQGRKEVRKQVRDACDFNNIETRAVNFFPPTRLYFLFWLRTYQHPCTTSHFSTTSRRELSSSFFSSPTRRSAEGNSHPSDRNISLFPSWSG